MEINVDISKQDVIDFNIFHFRNSKTFRQQRFCYFLVGCVFFVLWIALSVRVPPPLIKALAVFSPLALSGVFVFAYPLFLWRHLAIKLTQNFLREDSNKIFLGKQRVALEHENIKIISDLSESSIRWSAINKIVASENALYVYVSAVNASIVPRRFFTDSTSFESFAQSAKQLLKSAKDNV